MGQKQAQKIHVWAKRFFNFSPQKYYEYAVFNALGHVGHIFLSYIAVKKIYM